MSRSALTGGGKKVFREGLSVSRKGLEAQKEYIPGGKQHKKYAKAINRLTRHPEKVLDKAYEKAQKHLQPHFNEMQREFSQETAPELISNLGVGAGAKSSSALNQALSSSLTNLNARMQAAQNDLAQQYGNQFLQQKYQGIQDKYNAGLGAAQSAADRGMGYLGVQPYIPHSGQPGIGKQLLGHGINLAAQVGGTMVGGPLVGAGAGAVSSALTSKLTGGTQTPQVSNQFNDWYTRPRASGVDIGGTNQLR